MSRSGRSGSWSRTRPGLSEIVRAEIALAKAEISQDVKNGAMAGGMFGVAGYLGMLASITAVIAAGYGLIDAGPAALGGVPHRHRRPAAARRDCSR